MGTTDHMQTTTMTTTHWERTPDADHTPPDLNEHLLERLALNWLNFQRSLDWCTETMGDSAVHALRVEARRLQAIIKIIQHATHASCILPSRRVLKEVLRQFSNLRDVQVAANWIETRVATEPALAAFGHSCRLREARLALALRDSLLRMWLDQLQRDVAALHGALMRREHRESGQPTPVAPSTPLIELLQTTGIEVQHCATYATADDVDGIHALRIALRQFRHIAEHLRPFCPGFGPSHFSAMEKCQYRMGAIQDSVVHRMALEDYLAEANDGSNNQALQTLRIELARNQQSLADSWVRDLAEINACWPAGFLTQHHDSPVVRPHLIRGFSALPHLAELALA